MSSEYKPVRQGKYFEEFAVGDKYRSDGRTITTADIVMFATLIGAQSPQFLDEEYGKKSPLGSRVAPGPLGLSFALASTEPILAGTLIALLGIHSVRYHQPILPNDTIANEFEIFATRATAKPGRGIISIRNKVVNQRGEMILAFEHQLLIKSRDAE